VRIGLALLAWLGGTKRLMSADSKIGFHAARNWVTGKETGSGNALIGAYLKKLGLAYPAVLYITQASAVSITSDRVYTRSQQGHYHRPHPANRSRGMIWLLTYSRCSQSIFCWQLSWWSYRASRAAKNCGSVSNGTSHGAQR
jgi:hypothetical protein